MRSLRDEAKGRKCQIRLEGCKTGPCCLCHLRQIGISGMSMKAPDLLGAWGCASCHDKVDRTHRHDPAVQLDFLRAIMRTQNILISEEKVKW